MRRIELHTARIGLVHRAGLSPSIKENVYNIVYDDNAYKTVFRVVSCAGGRWCCARSLVVPVPILYVAARHVPPPEGEKDRSLQPIRSARSILRTCVRCPRYTCNLLPGRQSIVMPVSTRSRSPCTVRCFSHVRDN